MDRLEHSSMEESENDDKTVAVSSQHCLSCMSHVEKQGRSVFSHAWVN